MPTIFGPAARASLITRAGALAPEAPRRWGRMDAPLMLAHLTDALRMATGDLSIAPRGGPLSWPPVRHAIIHWLPFPKGAPTAPELLSRAAADFDEERRQLAVLLERVAAPGHTFGAHPAFGTLSREDWGVLIYRHMDHHLRQFGA
ncbi:MAG: DUF1569 domain-containing protein [Vicinamibacterales bacterium]